MARYSIDGTDTNTDNTTILYVAQAASPTTRLRIYDIILGARAAPQDYACGYEVQRFTAENGTPGGTAVTPQALDSGDGSATSNAVEGPSGEPTYTANAILLYFSLNQRATFRWVAAPGGELVVPATGDNGAGIVCDTPSTAFAVQACIHFEE